MAIGEIPCEPGAPIAGANAAVPPARTVPADRTATPAQASYGARPGASAASAADSRMEIGRRGIKETPPFSGPKATGSRPDAAACTARNGARRSCARRLGCRREWDLSVTAGFECSWLPPLHTTVAQDRLPVQGRWGARFHSGDPQQNRP